MTVTTLRRRDWHDLAARHRLIIGALRRGDQAEIGRVVREHVLTLGVEVARTFEEAEDQPAEVAPWRDPALLERVRT